MPYPSVKFKSSVLLLILAWMGAIGFAAHLLMSAEISRRETRFEEDVRLLTSDIQNKLDTNEAVLSGFAAFLSAVDRNDEEAVAQYAASVAAAYPHIYMLEVARRVSIQEEATFENALRRHWRSDFSLKDFARMTDRKSVSRSFQNDTWPILFLYPSLPEAHGIYGVRLETVDYLSHTLALAQGNPRVVGSPVFEMYEGGKAYILLKEVRRPPGKTSAANSSLFGSQMIALLLIKTDALFPMTRYQSIPRNITFSASLSHSPESIGNLFEQDSLPSTLLDRLLLPRFEKNLRTGNASQPVTLHYAQQLQWRDLMTAEKVTIFCLLAIVLFSIPALGIRHYRALKREVSEHQQSAYMATHDTLTGLPNRFLLTDHFHLAQESIQRSGRHLAVLLIDLDFFKLINDHHGHAIGDEVLKEVSNRLLDHTRTVDTVARYGGDEFVVLLTDLADISNARTIAENILEAIATPVPTRAGEMNLSCSIGIAVTQDAAKSMESLIHEADGAMYRSKKSGRNQIFATLHAAN